MYVEPKPEQELNDSRIQASQGTFEHENVDISVSSSEATDLSMIAHRFEQRCEESSLKGISSIIDGFAAVLRVSPSKQVDSLVVQISPRGHSGKQQVANSAECTQYAEMPLRSIEVWNDASTNRVMTSIGMPLHKSFKMRFKQALWNGRPVVVQDMECQMASTDAPQTEKVVVGGLLEEVHHLKTSALNILGSVCNGVRFEDVTTVPRFLTEAILRVVKPMTTSLKVEKVTLSLLIGDDPVNITTSIASEQQPALSPALQSELRALPPRVHLEIPSDTKSSIEQYRSWSPNK